MNPSPLSSEYGGCARIEAQPPIRAFPSCSPTPTSCGLGLLASLAEAYIFIK